MSERPVVESVVEDTALAWRRDGGVKASVSAKNATTHIDEVGAVGSRWPLKSACN